MAGVVSIPHLSTPGCVSRGIRSLVIAALLRSSSLYTRFCPKSLNRADVLGNLLLGKDSRWNDIGSRMSSGHGWPTCSLLPNVPVDPHGIGARCSTVSSGFSTPASRGVTYADTPTRASVRDGTVAASLTHRYWQRWWAEHYKAMGYTVQIEAPRHGGRFDVLACKDRTGRAERAGIEVETGTSDILSNANNGIRSGFDLWR